MGLGQKTALKAASNPKPGINAEFHRKRRFELESLKQKGDSRFADNCFKDQRELVPECEPFGRTGHVFDLPVWGLTGSRMGIAHWAG
jgi:hypothetical protein